MQELLREWNKANNERVKLQYTYAVLAISFLVIAGLSSLINYELGMNILVLAFALTVIFFVNAIGWVLLDAFVLKRLPKSAPRKK